MDANKLSFAGNTKRRAVYGRCVKKGRNREIPDWTAFCMRTGAGIRLQKAKRSNADSGGRNAGHSPGGLDPP